MAPTPTPFLISLTAFLLLVAAHIAPSRAKTHVAPGPIPPPLNITGILDKGSQYKTLIRLMDETQVGSQIQNQLNSSFDGLTIFAPTDNAFSNLKPGTLNSLSSQEQVALVLYHVLPRFYSLATFETTSNPVRTQASGNNGVYTVNVTSTTSQVNVSTGIDETMLGTDLFSDFPLAVYSVDKVLLPYDLFGAKPPVSAPPPSPGSEKPAKSHAAGKSAGGPSSIPSDASFKGRRGGWGFALGIGLACVGILV